MPKLDNLYEYKQRNALKYMAMLGWYTTLKARLRHRIAGLFFALIRWF
jgi:hypothetical protein